MQSFVQIMCDEDDGFGQIVLQYQQLILYFGLDQWIQCVEGFVYQDYIGIGCQCMGQIDVLFYVV